MEDADGCSNPRLSSSWRNWRGWAAKMMSASANAQLEILLPKLSPDALLLADNVLSHPQEVAEYRRMVECLPGFIWTVVAVGKGLHIAWRKDG